MRRRAAERRDRRKEAEARKALAAFRADLCGAAVPPAGVTARAQRRRRARTHGSSDDGETELAALHPGPAAWDDLLALGALKLWAANSPRADPSQEPPRRPAKQRKEERSLNRWRRASSALALALLALPALRAAGLRGFGPAGLQAPA